MVTQTKKAASKATKRAASATPTPPSPPTPPSLLDALPVDRLKGEVIELGKAMAHHGVVRVGEGFSAATGKLTGLAESAPSPGDVAKSVGNVGKSVGNVGSPLTPAKEAAGKVTGALKDKVPLPGKGGKAKDQDEPSGKSADHDTDLKVTNIVESVDVPVSRDVAYQLWTQFEEFPSFMKKVETVKQAEPEVVTWKAQVFWSHRTWTARIVDQVPPEHIVWKSEAEKGRVDGAVTFHELAPDLTRVLVSLEYHPQGLFERTGNLWHAQGRRVRLELKHFRRYVANHALMHQDDVDGWEGEIHDAKVKPRKTSSSTTKKSATKRTAAASKRTPTSKRTSSASKRSSTSKRAPSASKGPAKRGSSASKRTSSSSTPRKSTAKKTGGSPSSRSRSPRSKS